MKNDKKASLFYKNKKPSPEDDCDKESLEIVFLVQNHTLLPYEPNSALLPSIGPNS